MSFHILTPIVVCTGNVHKVDELHELMDLEMEPLPAGFVMPEETGSTFYTNAHIKAAAGRDALPGRWVLADDSGLEVDALDGAPGVYSARYAGLDATDEQNTARLLMNLKSITPDHRSARFRCSLVLLGPDGEEIAADGTVEGTIASEPRGTHGFGYDPVFVPRGYDKSFAELGSDIKHSLSHRANACRALLQQLN
jgi:XTP/dITP diphosphohydrolase